MDATLLGQLVRSRSVAALGTLLDGAPYVSMVPFVLAPDGRAMLIHVSQLAAHTRNMMQDRRVSVLLVESDDAGKLPQALARVTILGEAHPLAREDADYATAVAVYLKRFPDSAELFQFPDFHLFRIEVDSARFVGGFAQAVTLNADGFARNVVA